MARRASGRLFLGVLAMLAGVSSHASAQGDNKTVCTDSYVANQKLRREGKLTLAREQLVQCAQESCPGAIKTDCARWLGELEQNIPTIVIDAKGRDGKDTVAVRVFVDGDKVADQLDGRPIPIDPGAHTLRFEHEGANAVEQAVVVQQGVKNRSVIVSFAPAATADPEPNGGTNQPPPTNGDDGPPVHWAAVAVVGALSLGAFGCFIGFGVTGKNEADELDRTCGENAVDPNLRKTCTDEQIDPVRTKLIVADVSLGVGIAAAAVAIGLIVWNVAAGSSSSAVNVELGPTVGGAYGGVNVRF
jgi:hypothetical protein